MSAVTNEEAGPSPTNPLVAEPPPIDGTAGAGPLDSADNLAEDLKDGAKGDWDAFALAIDGVAYGLDVLAVTLNPLGELVKAGVGWLLEHLEFLREPLEVLTGDPKAIKAISDTWEKVAAELEAVAIDYDGALGSAAAWKGDAAEAYRKTAAGYTETLRGVADQARSAAQGVTTAGVVVATARGIIFDIIATFVSDVITRALIAAATSWCTLGGSLAAFTASVIADAAKVLVKVQQKIAKLLSAIQKFVAKFKALGTKSASAAESLGRNADRLRAAANNATHAADSTLASLRPVESTLSSGFTHRAARYADHIERDAPLRAFSGHGLTRLGKEAGKAATEQAEDAGDDDPTRPPSTSGRVSGSLDDGGG